VYEAGVIKIDALVKFLGLRKCWELRELAASIGIYFTCKAGRPRVTKTRMRLSREEAKAIMARFYALRGQGKTLEQTVRQGVGQPR
jgi:hypothetical protein